MGRGHSSDGLRRLAVPTVLVLAAHVVLLAPGPRRIELAQPRPVQFATRSVAAPVIVAPAAAVTVPLPAIARKPVARPAAAAPPRAPVTPAVTAPPMAPLAPARLHYEVVTQSRGVPIAGEAVLDWQHDGHAYEALLEVTGAGLPTRTQRSTGRIERDGLAPDYFAEKARGEQATHFDRPGGRIVFSNNRPAAALGAGMQDRLSVILQLAMAVGAQPAKFLPGTQVALPTASTREADTWIFVVEGEENLLLPGGEVPALKLQRLPRSTYDQKIEVWLAPRMDYAPARLRLTNPNGGAVDLRWSSTDRG